MPDIRNILIVEDDAAFADFVRAAVESLGHRAVIVPTGGAALDAFRQHHPDMVFLDLLLPQRDGFKVCEDIRREESGRAVPVVMMTGIYKKGSYEKEALERLKAAEYLIKPFGVREVWAAIEQCLGPSVLKGGGARIGAPAASGWALQDSALACQLAEHLRLKSDGVLFVRGTDATFVIYLRAGAPAFVRSSDPSDRLDRVVARTTRIPEAAIAACVKEAQESRGRKRFGDVLVERKHVTREELEIALQLQLRLILNRAFQLEQGCCLFVAGEHPTDEDVLLQAHPRALLVRGARATPPSVARVHAPPPASTLVRVQGWEALVHDLSLKEDELRLLQLCDGATTVERFFATAAVSGLDGPRILLALQCSGLVADIPDEKRMPLRRPALAVPDIAEWDNLPLGAMISDLYRRRASGLLEATIAAGEAPRQIWFRDGEIVAVTSEAREDRLAAMLRRMEVVDAPRLDEAEAALGRGASDALLVRSLIDRELLAPTEGYWAAVYQAHGSVHAILGARPLVLSWTDGPLPTGIVPLPDVPTIELALNGVRGLDAACVKRMLPHPGVRIVATPDAAAPGTPLSGGELAILGRLAAGHELTSFCSLAEDPAARARVVLSLLQVGLLEASIMPVTARSAPGAPATLSLASAAEFAEEAMPTPQPDAATAPQSSEAPQRPPAQELRERLLALRTTFRSLRSGFEGDSKRVSVDRERMAELFDQMLALTELAKQAQGSKEGGPDFAEGTASPATATAAPADPREALAAS